jgi:hypothetical protein
MTEFPSSSHPSTSALDPAATAKPVTAEPALPPRHRLVVAGCAGG